MALPTPRRSESETLRRLPELLVLPCTLPPRFLLLLLSEYACLAAFGGRGWSGEAGEAGMQDTPQ
jgi:hypothetical protein